jgi:hypothetical protein
MIGQRGQTRARQWMRLCGIPRQRRPVCIGDKEHQRAGRRQGCALHHPRGEQIGRRLIEHGFLKRLWCVITEKMTDLM